MRHANCHIMKNVAQGKIDGKRRKGRPPISYMDNITEWTKIPRQRVCRMAEGRRKWKQWTKHSPTMMMATGNR